MARAGGKQRAKSMSRTSTVRVLDYEDFRMTFSRPFFCPSENQKTEGRRQESRTEDASIILGLQSTTVDRIHHETFEQRTGELHNFMLLRRIATLSSATRVCLRSSNYTTVELVSSGMVSSCSGLLEVLHPCFSMVSMI